MSTATNFISKINQEFPVAGKDNSSQGFRDNFKNISQALNALDSDVENLKITTIKASQSNDFDNNLIKQAVFQDCSSILFDNTTNTQFGDVTLDYTAGSYQKVKISSGSHQFSVKNWPGEGKYASMIVAISTASTEPTFVDFQATNVYNLSTAAIPSIVDQGKLKVYELWNDGDELNLYVKEISSVISNTDINTTNVTATNIISTNGSVNSLTVSSLIFSDNIFSKVNAVADSPSATLVKAATSASNLALHVNIVKSTALNTITDGPLDEEANTFGVSSTEGIMVNSKFACTGTWTIFTVQSITTNTVTVSPNFKIGYGPKTNEVLKFYNPRYKDQPITMSFSSNNPTTDLSKYLSGAILMSVGDVKGNVFADFNNLAVCYRDVEANPSSLNAQGWVQALTLSGDHLGAKSIKGNNQFDGDVTFGPSSDVVIQNTNQSDSVGTGALVVSGGVGIGKNLRVGGLAAISGSLSSVGFTNAGGLIQGGVASFLTTSTFVGDFDVTGKASLTQINTSTFTGTATFSARAIFNGPTSYTNSATFAGTATFAEISNCTFANGIVTFNTVSTFNSTVTFNNTGTFNSLVATTANIGANTLDNAGIYPTVNNGGSVGTSSNKYAAVYATNGTIQTSDRRLKDNIQPSKLGLKFINDLKPVSYTFKDSPHKTRWGLIAQEVKETIDQHNVDFAGWHLDYTANPDSIQNLIYTEFVGPLIKAIQELSEQNNHLQNQIDELKKSQK